MINSSYTKFLPLIPSVMYKLDSLVTQHGFDFERISSIIDLPVSILKPTTFHYYSHLLAQPLYVPSSILDEIYIFQTI